MTAMIRNLAKMSTLGMLNGMPKNQEYMDMVVNSLESEDKLHTAGIHPLAILLGKAD